MSVNPLADFYFVDGPIKAYPAHKQQFKTATDLTQEQRRNATLIGIEIEVEKCRCNTVDQNFYDEVMYYWNMAADGSLRNNGQEFISRKGLSTVTLPKALDLLLNKRTGYIPLATKGVAEANARTGLHIHMNVGDKDYYELCNILFLYSMIEPAIFVASGNRCENLFCVPWYQNQVSLGAVIAELAGHATYYARYGEEERNKAFSQYRWRNYSKYCGLNVSTVSQYSTLEFRMHEGTLEPARIQSWVDSLERLFRVAKGSDLLDNLARFRSNRTDAKYLLLLEQMFGRIPKEITQSTLDDCRTASNNFYKAFVNRDLLPERVSEKLYIKPRRGMAALRVEERDDVVFGPLPEFDLPDPPPRRDARDHLAEMIFNRVNAEIMQQGQQREDPPEFHDFDAEDDERNN